MPYQIYIVEDHPIVRRAYAGLLARETDLALWGMAASGEEALKTLAERHKEPACDLIVVDLSMPGMDGLELVEHIRQAYPNLPVLVVSGHDEALMAERARRAGARAYLHKQGLADVLSNAIRAILQDVPSARP